ncbi:hypothetical protein FRB94_009102 [Tulasnella sp. JGI-2019a]|nr:hypothetical protein FRB94_009102 [Tulasnella sp. JGI-2019a]KAG9012320.1 hypothetical protein FRB93_001742 [Tulasnella sp. JGI-2019a]KAG9026308.1 hypothetical protein FRB95_009005 [Tulasnella sp. JGI-2019a]
MFEWLTGKSSAAAPPPSSATPAAAAPACEVNPLNPNGLKPCCACPETKSARDACFLNFDSTEADEKCKDLVQAHIACMRGYGFKV